MKRAIAIKLNDHYAKPTDGSCPPHHLLYLNRSPPLLDLSALSCIHVTIIIFGHLIHHRWLRSVARIDPGASRGHADRVDSSLDPWKWKRTKANRPPVETSSVQNPSPSPIPHPSLSPTTNNPMRRRLQHNAASSRVSEHHHR